MPKFLNRTEVYRLLQRELPPGVFPDGAEDSSYSTADMASVAAVAASAYANLEEIYNDYWPQTTTNKIDDWEFLAFGTIKNPGLPLADRRDRVTQQLRTRKGLTIQDMIDTVKSVIGTDKNVDLAEWGQETGGWMLDESELGISTILNGVNLLKATGADLCEKTAADFGLTQQEWEDMQREAYTYEIMIYDYTLTAEERTEIDQKLSVAEPARSTHVITDGLDSADELEIEE